MSAVRVVAPLFELRCDAEDCTVTFRSSGSFSQRHENGTRSDARDNGWQIRPFRGKGSRTAPDLCPEHRTDGGESR